MSQNFLTVSPSIVTAYLSPFSRQAPISFFKLRIIWFQHSTLDIMAAGPAKAEYLLWSSRSAQEKYLD